MKVTSMQRLLFNRATVAILRNLIYIRAVLKSNDCWLLYWNIPQATLLKILPCDHPRKHFSLFLWEYRFDHYIPPILTIPGVVLIQKFVWVNRLIGAGLRLAVVWSIRCLFICLILLLFVTLIIRQAIIEKRLINRNLRKYVQVAGIAFRLHTVWTIGWTQYGGVSNR